MRIDKTSVQATATVLMGVFGATISFLTWKGNHDAYCVSSVQTFINVSRQAYLSLPSDHYTNPLMRRIVSDCGFKADELLQLMGSDVSHVAKVDVHLQSAADSEKALKSQQKWVPLGIEGGASNFSINGMVPMAQWKQGDQITALEDVNVRANVANWSAPLEVITRGEVATLAASPVAVPDGHTKQYWGRLQ